MEKVFYHFLAIILLIWIVLAVKNTIEAFRAAYEDTEGMKPSLRYVCALFVAFLIGIAAFHMPNDGYFVRKKKKDIEEIQDDMPHTKE